MAAPTTQMRDIARRDHGWWCAYCAAALAQPFALVTTDQQGWDIYLGHLDGEPFWQMADGHHQATRDHIVPRVKGGTDDLDNLVLACRPCNTTKHMLGLLQFLARRAGLPTFKSVGATTVADLATILRGVA